MENKIYNEEEKNYHEKKAVHNNNKLLFDLIESHINCLITERLNKFATGYSVLSQQKEEMQRSL